MTLEKKQYDVHSIIIVSYNNNIQCYSYIAILFF